MRHFEFKLGTAFGALAICLASNQLVAQDAATAAATESESVAKAANSGSFASPDAQLFEPAYFT